MRHIKSCRTGEIIMDKLGGKCQVLGRCGTIIFRSEFNRYDIAAFHFLTWMEAEKEGWKLLTKEGKEPMSKSEVERLLGNVKITT